MYHRFDLAIFDCDGVILDSKEANRAFYNSILAEFGRRSMNEKELSFVHMNTVDESIKYLFRNDIITQKKAINYSRLHDYSRFLNYLRLEPGIIDTIACIRPPMLTAISTNRSTTMPQIVNIFELDKWFDIIVCALDVNNPKPNPEGVLKILDTLKVKKEQAVYIGDSVIDEIVAFKAEIPLIAYKNKNLKAMFHVEHFDQIKEIFLSKSLP
jgi:HAD superfamily hydrolase (TIGR01549 family)